MVWCLLASGTRGAPLASYGLVAHFPSCSPGLLLLLPMFEQRLTGASSEVRRCNSSVVVQMRWMRASFLPEIYLSTTVPSIARACSKGPLHLSEGPGKDSHAARVRGAGGE